MFLPVSMFCYDFSVSKSLSHHLQFEETRCALLSGSSYLTSLDPVLLPAALRINYEFWRGVLTGCRPHTEAQTFRQTDRQTPVALTHVHSSFITPSAVLLQRVQGH